MRLGYKKFKEIKKWYGSSDFEIGYDTNALTIRFGYWNSVNFCLLYTSPSPRD